MIDLQVLKEEPTRVKREIGERGLDLDFEKLVRVDALRRELQAQVDEKRAQQKAIKDAAAGKKLKTELRALEEKFKAADAEFTELALQVPNFHHETTPVGKDESENAVAKTVGDKPDTKDPKPHYEIPAIAPLIDFERGAKVSGSRFWFLKGALVHLEAAIIRYALDFYGAKGFEPMRPPSIVNRAAMEGTGFFPADANEIYLVQDNTGEEQKYLAGTAEVPLASYHADETLNPEQLPIKFIGFSPAYRREAGSYGKDTKGILRGHEFDKLELFVFSHPDKSWEMHEELQSQAEEFWTSLGIPFQVLNMCTGDIGAPNAKKYDLEAWMPGEGKYREVASNSNDTDFQARRLKIRYGKGKAEGLVHTLNNTATAIGRTIIAIVENYQTAEGTVKLPKVLHPYLPSDLKEIKGD